MSDSSIVARLDHVGIDVRDLDGQVAFYQHVFDLQEHERMAIPQRRLVRVLLASADAHWYLELFHRPGAAAVPDRTDDTQHDTLGIGHLAVACGTADEVGRLHDRAVSAGALSLMTPQAIGGPEIRAYLRDPEGVLLELIERRDRPDT